MRGDEEIKERRPVEAGSTRAGRGEKSIALLDQCTHPEGFAFVCRVVCLANIGPRIERSRSHVAWISPMCSVCLVRKPSTVGLSSSPARRRCCRKTIARTAASQVVCCRSLDRASPLPQDVCSSGDCQKIQADHRRDLVPSRRLLRRECPSSERRSARIVRPHASYKRIVRMCLFSCWVLCDILMFCDVGFWCKLSLVCLMVIPVFELSGLQRGDVYISPDGFYHFRQQVDCLAMIGPWIELRLYVSLSCRSSDRTFAFH